jgi:hypothetical protein
VHLVNVLELEPLSSVTLLFADLSLSGHVVPNHGGTFAGASHYWLAGGAGGWRKLVKARGYRNDAGVKLSVVVVDLARDTGETIAPGYTDRILGGGFERPEQEASATLRLLSPDAWYVGEDGKTRIGRRAASTLDVPAEHVLRRRPDRSFALLALDKLAGLAPEATAAGMTIARVVHTLGGAQLRSRIWGAS